MKSDEIMVRHNDEWDFLLKQRNAELERLEKDYQDALKHLDQALRQWYAYASFSEESDLEIANNPEADLYRAARGFLGRMK